jgi:hypothetical protein
VLYVANATETPSVGAAGLRCGGPLAEKRIEGYIPTDWYPGAIEIDGRGDFLFVANIKGCGSRNMPTESDKDSTA